MLTNIYFMSEKQHEIHFKMSLMTIAETMYKSENA